MLDHAARHLGAGEDLFLAVIQKLIFVAAPSADDQS